jgi:hypothetical protein
MICLNFSSFEDSDFDDDVVMPGGGLSLFFNRTLFDDLDVFLFEDGVSMEGGGVELGGTSAVLQIIKCRKTPLVYGQRSKFDQKGGSRKPAHLACITVKRQGLNYTI